METHKPLSASAEMPKRSPFFLVLAVIVLLAIAAGAFYLGLQKSAIEEQKKAITLEMDSLQTEIASLQGQSLEAAQMAQQWLDQVQSEEILWSRVITRIEALIPVDVTTGKQKIDVLSYSGSTGGKVALNAKTVEAQQEPYEYVAELLSVFNNSSDFQTAIIPSVTKGETDQGGKLLSFVMTFAFNQNGAVVPQVNVSSTDGAAATGVDATGTATDESKPKVPRQ
jgi:hypothetical protein